MINYDKGEFKMKRLKKGMASILVILTLFVSLAGCSSSSSDPLTDSTLLFSAISRIERQTPGGMGFTTEQAEELLNIINPVLMGTPYTEDVAKKMYDQTYSILTKEQQTLVDQTIKSMGDPNQMSQLGMSNGTGNGTGVPGSGAGMGGGMGGTGVPPGSRESIDPTGTAGMNMLLRLDDVITQNYLNN